MSQESKSLKIINEEFENFLSGLEDKIDKKEVRRAYEFAKNAHMYQQRQGGDPYIIHPLEVSKIVADLGLETPSIVASFLHDVVEDTEITQKDVRDNFGNEVSSLVNGLTKIQHFGENKSEKNIVDLRKILLASAKDIRVLIIKLADRLHNMRTLDITSKEKQERVARETLRIYVPIAQKIGIYSLKWELEDLSFKYMNPEMFFYIREKIGLKREEREEIINKAVEEIKEVLAANDLEEIRVLGRPKNFYSIYKKIKDNTKKIEDLYDLYAVRIITKSVSQCYTTLGVLHEHFQAVPERLKDYIANPKSNGYQSIHTSIVSSRLNFPIEVQIRTEDMHKLAEFGVAAHWKYKNIDEDKKFEKKISWLREVMEWEKDNKDNDEFLSLLKFNFFENEIFVFSPQNDVYVLPENATVIDFAYAVHSDIGNRAYKAKVNGFITTIDRRLRSGDIVEIVTHKGASPNEKWLKFAETSKARTKIRQAINVKHSGKRDVDTSDEGDSFEKLKEKITRVNEFKKVRKAGCCGIEYGDQIVGVLSKSKELVIHNASCENAKYTLNKKLPLNWIEEKDKFVDMSLILKDRFGLLMDIMNIFSEFNLNISKLNTKVLKNGSVKMNISLKDGPHIDKLTERLQKIDFVQEVKVYRGFLSNFNSLLLS